MSSIPTSFKKSIAAPRPMTPAMTGVPPSNFHGKSAHVESCKSTKSIILPPNSTNSICSPSVGLPSNTQFLSAHTFYGLKMHRNHSLNLEHLRTYVELLGHRRRR